MGEKLASNTFHGTKLHFFFKLVNKLYLTQEKYCL